MGDTVIFFEIEGRLYRSRNVTYTPWLPYYFCIQFILIEKYARYFQKMFTIKIMIVGITKADNLL